MTTTATSSARTAGVDHIISAYRNGLGYADMLLKDIPEERRCEQSGKIVNHAAWQLGHILYASDWAGTFLGEEPHVSPEWVELFKMGSQPTSNTDDYPTLKELHTALKEQNERNVAALRNAAPETLAAENTQGMQDMCPTNGDVVSFLLTLHEAVHLGQLSAWRRALGMDNVMGV